MALALKSPRSSSIPDANGARPRFAAAAAQAAARDSVSVQESQALLRAAAESGAQQRRLASESSRLG